MRVVTDAARTRWLEHTEAVLRGAGLRASAGRSAVVELLARQRCVVSAQEIVDRLRTDDDRSASQATVYRALETLHEHGLVRRLESEGIARYEPVDPSGEHHHHVVFEDGEVAPFEDTRLEHAIEGLGERLGIEITGHDVILRARRR